MRVSDAMTREVRVCIPSESIRDCAATLAHNDIGALPVAEVNLLVGMVTDRDITLRAIAAGKGPDTPVRDVASNEVLFCFEDEQLAQVAKSMGLAKVRRLPVLSRDQRVVSGFLDGEPGGFVQLLVEGTDPFRLAHDPDEQSH